jgi:hypothetical protein
MKPNAYHMSVIAAYAVRYGQINQTESWCFRALAGEDTLDAFDSRGTTDCRLFSPTQIMVACKWYQSRVVVGIDIQAHHVIQTATDAAIQRLDDFYSCQLEITRRPWENTSGLTLMDMKQGRAV